MSDPQAPVSVTVPAEDAFDGDGNLVLPDVPDGYLAEMVITVHAEVRDPDGNLVQTTNPE